MSTGPVSAGISLSVKLSYIKRQMQKKNQNKTKTTNKAKNYRGDDLLTELRKSKTKTTNWGEFHS